MSNTYFTQQAMKNMAPMLYEKHKLEIFTTITSFVWLFSAIFPDSVFFIFSLVFTISLTIFLAILSLLPSNNYQYSLNSLFARRLFIAAWAHWAYFSGRWVGPSTLNLEGIEISILLISQYTLIGLLFLWFSTRYFDQLQDPNITSAMFPFILIRGVLRAAMLSGLVFAIVSSDLIPSDLAIPYLLVIYLVEPYIFGFSQLMNPTMSRFELTLGNARLPSVALRESFLSNFFILFFTVRFSGLEGTIWRLMQVYFFFGALLTFFYSQEAIKNFKKDPLGKNPIASFFNDTPDILNNINLQTAIGHYIDEDLTIDLSKKAGLNIEKGSIIVPLDETKGKMNALVIGKGQSILETGGKKVAEKLEGVSTVMIPKKEFKKVTKVAVVQRLNEMNLQELKLPSIEELQQYVGLLSRHFEGFVGKLVNQMNAIDLSNYGISEMKGRTDIKLPGIEVHETPDLTSVKVGGIRVLDGKGATTVRLGNLVTVVDLPKASFVSIPGITVVDIGGEGSAVNLFGFQISDGLSASKLEEIRANVMEQLNRWEMNIDAELGRYLADKSATGLLSVGWDGEFNLLLDSNRKTMGNHIALELESSSSKNMHYLPPNFDEKINEVTEEDVRFQQLTGLNPTPALKSQKKKPLSLGPATNEEDLQKLKNDTYPSVSSKKSSEHDDPDDDYVIIHDVEIEEDDE